MDRCDVLIIGAGIAGASAAYELQAFASVALVERESQPGYHATGRSAALFAPAEGDRVTRALTWASRAFYEARAGGLADHPVLGPRGSLTVAPPAQVPALERLAQAIAPYSPGLERLDAAGLQARLPALRPGWAAAGLLDPSTFDVDVAAVHQGYLRGFRARGGTLLTNAEVMAVGGGDGGTWRVETRAGAFAAAVLVDAAGAWADAIARLAGVTPLGLVALRRTAFVFEPSRDVEPGWPLVEDAAGTFYVKPEAGLLLGSPVDETPVAPGDVQAEELDVALAAARIEEAFRFHVLRVRRKWAGLRTFAPDRVPVVGMDERTPGFFWLAGQGGAGIQSAPALARAAAGLIVDGVLPDDLLAEGLCAEDLMPARLRLNDPVAR
jgi:D-arginine dehydrogenase